MSASSTSPFRKRTTPHSKPETHDSHRSSIPMSQASSTARLSTSNSRNQLHPVNRKRSREDTFSRSSHDQRSSPRASSAFSSTPRTASPAPLTNARYRLAGGMDSPMASAMERSERRDWEGEEDDFRRRWTPASSERSATGVQIVTVGPLARERNGGRKRSRSDMDVDGERPAESWTQFVANMVGGLASVVWDFCWSHGFKGFTAGGDGSQEGSNNRASTWVSVDSEGRTSIVQEREGTPVPGQFPDDERSQEHYTPEDVDYRGTKRRQTGRGSDWVMVNHRDVRTPQSRHSTPATGSRPSRSLLPRPTATRVVSTKHGRPSTARLSSVSHTGSPAAYSGHAASTASPRASLASAQPNRSPAEVDIERYTVKRERDERQNDASMRKLNQQLKAMIREGKQALETKVEIEDDFDMEDESFADSQHVSEADRRGR